MIMKFKKTVAVDFDGVLNEYRGFDEKNLYTPRKGAKEFLETLTHDYTVIVHTSRDRFKVEQWLRKYNLDKYVRRVSNTKPPAVAYIDDRAINYDDDYMEVLKKLDNFKTWWEK